MAALLLPIPRNIEWQDWADTVVGQNPSLVNRVSPDDDWRSFADRLTSAFPATPRHDSFAEWDEWAERLIEVIGP